MKKVWRLDPKEVSCGSSLYFRDSDPFDLIFRPDAEHAYQPIGAQGRKNNLTVMSLMMCHPPTGVEVNGKYYGYYTRKERALMLKLLAGRLFLLLEKRAAKKLAVPGR